MRHHFLSSSTRDGIPMFSLRGMHRKSRYMKRKKISNITRGTRADEVEPQVKNI